MIIYFKNHLNHLLKKVLSIIAFKNYIENKEILFYLMAFTY